MVSVKLATQDSNNNNNNNKGNGCKRAKVREDYKLISGKESYDEMSPLNVSQTRRKHKQTDQ